MVSNGPVFDRQVARRSIGFALHWQKSIGLRDEMVSAFEEFRALVNAHAVLHVRHNRGSCETYSAARDGASAGKLFAQPQRSFSRVVLGEHLYSAKPGRVWLLSDAEPDSETRDELTDTGLAEVVIVPLENGPAHSDFLEIQFTAPIAAQDWMLLEVLCPTIAEAWQARSTGSVAAMMSGRASRVAQARSSTAKKPILDIDNPAGLTRSEFQVCVMIHEGPARRHRHGAQRQEIHAAFAYARDLQQDRRFGPGGACASPARRGGGGGRPRLSRSGSVRLRVATVRPARRATVAAP